MTRVCARCDREKPIAEFRRRRGGGNKGIKWCFDCRQETGAFDQAPSRPTRGRYITEDRPVRPEEVLDKWEDFGSRLVKLRQRYGSAFADFAAGQLAVIEAIVGDLAIAVGREAGSIVVTFRRRKRSEIDGQMKLWNGEEAA